MLLAEVEKVAPHLKAFIQTRRTVAADWPRFTAVPVGCDTGRARAEILAKALVQ